MLRANLYKKFSKSNLPKAVDGVDISNTAKTQFQGNTTYPFNFKTAPGFNSYTTEAQPDGTITDGNYSYAPGTFNTDKAPNTFTADAAPFITNINPSSYDVDPNTPEIEQGPILPQSEVDKRKAKKTSLDYNSMFTLGLGAIDMGLGYNEDLKNQRILNESIQNRQSKPLYDYNYMYGRTTSGGTEYQPTIKAEMGAQITKRFNTPYGANNVEIEGGEFIQLPNFDTEHAEGPSHERGGIKTNLPEGTRVYSDHLKPEGSKKTFAQLAKKYDISDFKKVIDNPFRKQVDKDTATLMLKRNQAKLDELFNSQQSMNGDSNGEMRDGGIHNPGFQALPKAVQDQIIANMEYGGYQLPEYAIGGTIDQLASQMINQNKTGANLLNQKPSQQLLGTQLRPTTSKNINSAPKNVQSVVNNPSGVTKEGIPTYTAEDIKTIQQWDPNFNPTIETVPGLQKTQGSTYGEPTNQELFNKNYQWYTDKLKAEGKTFNPSNKGDVAAAQKAYHSEMTKRFIDAGYTPEEANVAITKYGFTDKEGVPNAFDDKLGKYTASRQLFNVAKKTPVTPETPVVDPGTPKGNDYTTKIDPLAKGRYTKQAFDISQSIPNIYGLAEAQSIYPYAIPEIDAPYIKPQTLNIQSELQDFDNMGTAAVRAGADPLSTYLAGMDAKQKAFQTKQNYDAEGRSKADMFNAQGQLSADQMNAGAFNTVYNQMIGQARDAQSAEKQASIANLVKQRADWNANETSKDFFYNNFIPSYNLDPNKTTEMEVANSQPFTRTKKPDATKTAKKGMLVSKATSKKSLTKFK